MFVKEEDFSGAFSELHWAILNPDGSWLCSVGSEGQVDRLLEVLNKEEEHVS